MATSGLLINESNIYGLVNPPPNPSAYEPKAWQTVGSGAVRWDEFLTLKGRVDTLVNDAPGTLDTLNELAAALNDDASFSTTVTNSIAAKAALAGATFTGDVIIGGTGKNLKVSGHNGTDTGLFLNNTLVTATAAELNFMDGVTSNVQTQVDAKMALAGGTFTGAVTLSGAPTSDLHAATKKYVDDNGGNATLSGAGSTIDTEDLTVSRALVSNASGKVAVSVVTLAELAFLDGVTSAVQTQLDAKQASSAKLTAVAALAVTDGGIIVGDGSTFVLESGATARTSLGVDAAGTDNSTNVTLANVTGNYLTLSGQEITAGTVPVALGGSGATTASGARTNLGVAIGSDVQAYHANLADIAGLSKTANNFIVADGSNFTLKTAADSRTALGLGALATAGTISNANWSGADLAVANGGTGASDAAGARTALGVEIGSDVQAYDAGLLSIAALTTAANKMIYTTDADTYAVTTLTAAGRNLLDDATAAAQCTTLGLGTGSDVTFNQVTAALVGNASTATKLAATKTIGGVAFDGSANIDLPGVNSAGNQNTTGTAANLSGSQTQKYVYAAPNANDGTASFRALVASDIPTLNQATTANAATATKLAATKTIGGVAFDGSANIDLPGVNAAGNQNTTGNAATASAAAGGSALETALAAKAALAGATYTGFVTLHAEPTAALHAASKSYVDSVAAGLDPKESVRVATTAAGTLATSFANGETVDGITLATGDRILIKTQADGSENGIYTVNASGAPTRATDFDSTTEVTAGAFTFIEEGTTNASTGFVLSTTGSITVGTTAMTFTQFSSSAVITAGTGLTKSGSELAVNAAQTQITSVGTLSGLTVGGNLTVSDGAYDLDVASHDGSNGLKLGGTLVTATAAELNYMDGVTSAVQTQLDAKGTGTVSALSDLSITATTAELNILDGSATTQATVTLADGDGVVISDGDVMKQCLVSDFKTYVADLTLTTAAQTNITSVGTLTALTVDDVAIDGKVITMTGSTSDTAVLTVAEHGALAITTTDDAGAAANITITADGTAELAGTTVTLNSSGGIELNADSGTIEFKDDSSSLGTITSSGYSGNAATATTLTNLTSTVAELNILDGVTAVAAELNILDGDTTATTSTLVDADGVVINDGGTMKQCLASDFKTYIAGLTLTTAAQTAITSVGTLTSLKIADDATIGSASDADAITIAANGTCTFSAGISGTLTGNVTGNVTGNCSGTAATVTGAAQTNITSVGTLTALTVDDVAIDGKVITMTGSTSDTAVLTVAEHGALAITTTDDAGAAANITITADGTAELAGTTVTLNSSGGITLDADGGTITFSDNGVSLGTITSVGGVGHYSGNSATASSISGLTSTVAELNILDGVTAEAAELNILDGVTSSTTELNIVDGDTTQATVTLAGGDGVVINDNGTMKQCLVSDFKTYVADLTLTTAAQAAITSVGTLTGLTVNGDVTISDGENDFNIASHDGTNGLQLGGTQITATAAQLNYVTGVTSAIQTQLDTKATLASPTLTGTPLAPTASDATNNTQIATTAYVTTAITNTDIANATDAATANKIVKRDSNGNAAFVNVTASVITTGTSGGVGADVSSLTTRVTALEDSVKSSGSAPTTATVGVVGDMLFTTTYLYILVSTSGSGGSITYNWKKVALVDL